MKFLIDTHAFLWFVNGDSGLSPSAQSLITDPSNQRYLSTGSFWEMAIKVGLGKLDLDMTFEELFWDHVETNDIEVLTIQRPHLDVYTSLPFHHKDPFDRLIIAQGLAESIPIITHDAIFVSYGVGVRW